MKEALLILLWLFVLVGLFLFAAAKLKSELCRFRDKRRIQRFREGLVDVIKSLMISLTIFLRLGVFSKEKLEKMGIKMDC